MQCVAGNASGTVNGYVNRRCRCPKCRTAWAKYNGPRLRAWRRQQKQQR